MTNNFFIFLTFLYFIYSFLTINPVCFELDSAINNSYIYNSINNTHDFRGQYMKTLSNEDNTEEMLGNNVPAIKISKGNLKKKIYNSLPLNMFNKIDDLFDSFFDELTTKLVKSEIENATIISNINLTLKKLNNTISNSDESEFHPEHHEEHIILKGIKDITNNEVKENSSGIKTKESDETNPESEPRNITFGHKIQENSPDQKNENAHSLAISYAESKLKPDDLILTTKERIKQIKDEKKKSFFSKICKYVFYCITLFAIYIVIKKFYLLKLKLIENKNNDSSNQNIVVSDKNDMNHTLELKNTSIKNE